MHMFHDCSRAKGSTANTTFALANSFFSESVAWLRCLIFPFQPWLGQVPREEDTFVVIFFLHRYQLDPTVGSTRLRNEPLSSRASRKVFLQEKLNENENEPVIFAFRNHYFRFFQMADKLLSIGEEKRKNLEDLAVVWLDKESHDLKARTRLRCIINFLKIFTGLADCLDYIRSVPEEHLFVIVSGQLSSSLIPSVRDLPQVLHVYVFCQHPERYLPLPSGRVFASEEVLYQQLSKDVNHFYATHATVLSGPAEKSVRDLGEKKGQFFWFQIFITALVDMVPSEDAKGDLLRLARTFYADNELESTRIDQFAQTYQASEALNWYSCDSFVYRVLNKAVRTEDLDLVFACRFFITDLYRQLETLHKPFVESMRSRALPELTVYHGQQLIEEDLTRLVANVGQLISVNSFFSTSLDRKVAMIYAGEHTVQANMKPVLFQVRIPLQERSNTYQHPFADISTISQFQEEQEVLFALAAMFLVESITKEE